MVTHQSQKNKLINQGELRTGATGTVIHPFGFEKLEGLATFNQQKFLILDTEKGYVATVDDSNNTTILNSRDTEFFRYASGIDYYHNEIWYAKNKRILRVDQDLKFEPSLFAVLPHRVLGVVVTKREIFAAAANQKIYVFQNDRENNPKNDRENNSENNRENNHAEKEPIRTFSAPGVGVEDITFHNGELWVCDREEQTIYCLDPETGSVKYSLLVPFESPTAITFRDDRLYVAYSNEECAVRDNGAGETLSLVADTHARNFIHRLSFQHHPNQHYTLSGGYLLEVSYVEEVDPVRDVDPIDDAFEWLIGLPSTSNRQEVIDIQPIGRSFEVRNERDQQYAVFKFDGLDRNEHHLIGWKALLKVRAIKYNLNVDAIDDHLELPDDIRSHYLEDDDDLAMDTAIVQRAARTAAKGATNIVDKTLKIRNYVYDQLKYNMEGPTDPPDVVLRRGDGSCGEYLGVLLALTRLNGIASRKVGRYKVPYYKVNPETRQVPVEPDFNHVWLEFYVPGYGWIPMESSADDVEIGKLTLRYFMGLQWYHIELQRGLPFEQIRGTNWSVGDLGMNDIRFRILEELEY